MLHRIIGRAGSGKSEYIKTLLGEKIEQNAQCVVIVPVQQSMEYEKDVCVRFGAKANLSAEVLTFDRLPNRTYREYGELAENYTDEGGRALMMASALENVRGELEEFAPVCGENSFIQKMIETSRVLKENGIDHKLLSGVGAGRLGKKARETDRILCEYDSMFGENTRDVRDVLTVYAQNLKRMPFFKGKTVFVDSFNSFTEQQQRVLDEIYSQCDELYVAICCDAEDKSEMFTNPSLAYARLARHKKYEDIEMQSGRRFVSPCLAYIEQNLWNDRAPAFGGGCGDVRFIKCASVFEEAEAAAYAAIEFAGSGMRWRDIVIIARNPESSLGVLDAVLQKHSVPCFFSAKEDTLTKPLSVFLTSALECAANDFQTSSVIKLVKSGYMPVSPSEAELITRYAQTWNIRGKKWINDVRWLMNPDGFSARDTKNNLRRLEIINNARWKISAVLGDFYEKIRSGNTYASGAEALYGLLLSVNAADQVRAKAKALRESGDDAGAQRLTRLWDIVISALEQLHDAGGEREVTPAVLQKRLELVLGTYSLGAVPAVCDSVIIGGASVFRANNPRAVILFGANDGEFPASPSVNGVFDRDEVRRLAERDIYIEDTFDRQIANEKLFFYLASCSASEKLVCIYSTGGSQRPSIGAMRLARLCPGSETVVFGETPETLVFSAASAREHSHMAKGDAAILLREKGLDDMSSAREFPLCDKDAVINYIDDGTVSVSPTRFERYSNCPFSYFANEILKLKTKPEAKLDAPELGIFVHRLLQLFVSEYVGDASLRPLDDAKLTRLADRYTEDYIVSLSDGGGELPESLVYSLGRLKKVMKLLFKNVADELERSHFTPVAFEQPMRYRFVAEGGLNVDFSGIADRIDTRTEDGVTYVRIVDYKTGSRKFSKQKLDLGLDLQLMLYMDVYLKQHSDPPHAPAAVGYYPARISAVKYEDAPDDAALNETIAKSLRFSGIDASSSGRSALSGEEFRALLKKTENCLKKTAALIVKGKMDVSPLHSSAGIKDREGKKIGGCDACKYCDHKSFCRLSDDFRVKRGKSLIGEVNEP
ncbi:MAG: PD-(D/E)XK nuclease family protein [Clostridia bacterium]|nr:PD-(D/E)XK nuclease family protein [Clostridia bacterium]MBP5237585.1 PD-(D/E)XK nuclease family protein [Clostridia bacterium]